MEISRSVAVLTEHPFASVDIIFEVDVVFCVEFWLGVALFVVGWVVGGLHRPLITHPYTLSSVVASGACLCGDPGVGGVADLYFCVSGGLDLVYQKVSRFVFWDGWVISFVVAVIAVGDMA